MRHLRKFLLPALGATLVALGLGSAANAQTPKRGGMLTHVVESEPNSIDCHASATSFTLQLMSIHYSTLLKYDPKAYPSIIGDLADSWTISPDGKTYTFKLKTGVKFHDGSDFSSEDIKATFDRLRNPPEGVISARREQFAEIESITTPDPATVVFQLRKANPATLSVLASPWNCVYSAKKLKEDPNFPAKTVLGTGPFKFVEYVKGSHWTGERFPDYFRKGLPYLDSVKAVFLTGPGVINALAGGQVDGTFFLIAPAAVERLRSSLGDKMSFPSGPINIVTFVTVNTAKPPFNDVRVRKALNLAIDRKEGLAFLKDLTNYQRGTLLMPPSAPLRVSEEDILKLPSYNEDAQGMAKRREQARALLKEAGQEKLKLTLLNRNIRVPWEPTGIFLLDQFRKIGIDADQIMAETPQYFSMLRDGTYDIAIDFNNTTGTDPNEVLPKFLPGSPNNYNKAVDPVLTELFEKQTAAASDKNDAERLKLVQQFEMRVFDQSYVLPTHSGNRFLAYRSFVKGFPMMPSTTLGLDMSEVWLDK